jgi:DNA repair protein RadC
MEKKYKVAEIQVSYLPKKSNKPKLTSSQEAYEVLKTFFPKETIGLQEKFMAMYLNNAHRVIGVYPLSTGGITGTIADVRLILSVALKTAATAMIIAHNHPSGSLKPSIADQKITRIIGDAAKIMDIKLLDHFIITGDEYYSFADNGLISYNSFD